MGYITYTVKPKAGLATGTQIRNVADVTFDLGNTIATDQVSETDPTPGRRPDQASPRHHRRRCAHQQRRRAAGRFVGQRHPRELVRRRRCRRLRPRHLLDLRLRQRRPVRPLDLEHHGHLGQLRRARTATPTASTASPPTTSATRNRSSRSPTPRPRSMPSPPTSTVDRSAGVQPRHLHALVVRQRPQRRRHRLVQHLRLRQRRRLHAAADRHDRDVDDPSPARTATPTASTASPRITSATSSPTPASAQATTTVDAAPPTSTVAALPAFSPGSFTVSWSGQRQHRRLRPGQLLDLRLRQRRRPSRRCCSDTTQTSTTFTGLDGHTYGFYSVATDNVGNLQAAPRLAAGEHHGRHDATDQPRGRAAGFQPRQLHADLVGQRRRRLRHRIVQRLRLRQRRGLPPLLDRHDARPRLPSPARTATPTASTRSPPTTSAMSRPLPRPPRRAPRSMPRRRPAPSAALPATEASASFTVSWSGQDNPGGSGLASYSIYVSTDGGPFTAPALGHHRHLRPPSPARMGTITASTAWPPTRSATCSRHPRPRRRRRSCHGTVHHDHRRLGHLGLTNRRTSDSGRRLAIAPLRPEHGLALVQHHTDRHHAQPGRDSRVPATSVSPALPGAATDPP